MINIVTEPVKWILGRWAEELAQRIPNCTVSLGNPRDDAKLNVFCNYALYRPVATKTASVFTHREFDPGLAQLFDDVGQKSDWCFAQCQRTLSYLPQDKSSILPIGIGKHFHKDKIRVGFAGKEKFNNRKRYGWIDSIAQIDGIEVVRSDGLIPYEDMHKFYDSVDYVVVTSDNEGGPMCIPEALARGKMVISTRCGWAESFPIILYDTLEELVSTLKGLVIPKDTWESGAKAILEVYSKLCG